MADLFFNWLGREGGVVVGWWLLLAAAGAMAWPLGFRLLGGLPDRAYSLARTLGLLLIAFVFWLAASLGLFQNTNGSVILAALVVLLIGLILLLPRRQDFGDWVRANWKYMLFVEVLFAVLFFGWVVYRACAPWLTGTEKPMELAFTSAIQRSLTFPPADPWMSGYAISYYHFGYVMAAVLGNLVGTQASMTFNLMIPTLFALTGVGVFGVVYNLLRSRTLGHRRKGALMPTSRKVAIAFGLLGVVFVLLLGNFYTVLVEIPYQSGSASEDYLTFWDVEERDQPIDTPRGSVNDWNHWWWFRSSRVIRDYDLSGAPAGIQPIDEFPAFSFVLADMHPHVLALPFAVLALGLALNLLLTDHDATREQLVLYGLTVGGLIFLNTWDGPIYLAVLLGAEALRCLRRNATGRLARADWLALLKMGAILLGLAVVLYAPFLIGFRSQLGGILPNVIHTTRIHQFFMMFGPFLLILGAFIGVEVWRGRGEMDWRLARNVILFALAVLILGMIALGLIAWLRPEIRGAVYSIVDAAGGLFAQVGVLLNIRLAGLPLLLLLGGLILLVVARLFGRAAIEEDEFPYASATGFALLLVGAGAVLALLPDYLYLRDNFMVRINTMFKLYYQTWLLWAIASAYGAYTILFDVEWQIRPSAAVRTVFGVGLAIILVAGLSYTALATYSRTMVESGRAGGALAALTLDGASSLARGDDLAAIRCLQDLVGRDEDVVLVEALGTAYDIQGRGRVSALTGIPTLLQWEGHERQWRGPTYDAAAGTRAADIERLYNDPSMLSEDVRRIVQQYGIDYIYVGAQERANYDSFGLIKFETVLTPVCQSGDTVVYRVGTD